MQPEAVSTGLVAAHHAALGSQAKPLFHGLEGLQHGAPVAARYAAAENRLAKARREAQLPRPFPELERDAEGVLECARIKAAGRCCHHESPP